MPTWFFVFLVLLVAAPITAFWITARVQLQRDARAVLAGEKAFLFENEIAERIGHLRATDSRFQKTDSHWPAPGYKAKNHTPSIERVSSTLRRMARRGSLESQMSGFIPRERFGYRLPQTA